MGPLWGRTVLHYQVSSTCQEPSRSSHHVPGTVQGLAACTAAAHLHRFWHKKVSVKPEALLGGGRQLLQVALLHC